MHGHSNKQHMHIYFHIFSLTRLQLMRGCQVANCVGCIRICIHRQTQRDTEKEREGEGMCAHTQTCVHTQTSTHTHTHTSPPHPTHTHTFTYECVRVYMYLFSKGNLRLQPRCQTTFSLTVENFPQLTPISSISLPEGKGGGIDYFDLIRVFGPNQNKPTYIRYANCEVSLHSHKRSLLARQVSFRVCQ